MTVTTDFDWRTRAACSTADPELMHTTKRADADHLIHELCFRCPVRSECLKDVMTWPAMQRNSGLVAGGRYFGRSGGYSKNLLETDEPLEASA